MISRFFCPGPLRPGPHIALPREVAHHAERVLRLAVGDEVVLFDGGGAEFPARLLALGAQARAEVTTCREPARESPLELTLVQALATGDKMDWVIQKAVELGVAAVEPCEQSGRNRIPEIAEIRPFMRYLAEPGEPALRLLLDPADGQGLSDLPRPLGPVHVLIGPEGGWAEAELRAARAAGCTAVRLGPRVLRTETAGLAMVAALQARWGDFRSEERHVGKE